MSRNQKAPLLAFALVALVCGLVLVGSMRGEAEPHPQDVASRTESGPAYQRAPEQPPIAPDDQSDEGEPSREESNGPDLAMSAASATPEGTDEGPSADSQASVPVGNDDGAEVQGTPWDDEVDAIADDLTDVGELWPPSSVPGIKTPVIVAFTIFGPDDVWPGASPSDEPAEDPTTGPTGDPTMDPTAEADQGGGQGDPRDPDPSSGPNPDQGDPISVPSDTQSAAPSGAP